MEWGVNTVRSAPHAAVSRLYGFCRAAAQHSAPILTIYTHLEPLRCRSIAAPHRCSAFGNLVRPLFAAITCCRALPSAFLRQRAA